jgi:hypothetical protein
MTEIAILFVEVHDGGWATRAWASAYSKRAGGPGAVRACHAQELAPTT